MLNLEVKNSIDRMTSTASSAAAREPGFGRAFLRGNIRPESKKPSKTTIFVGASWIRTLAPQKLPTVVDITPPTAAICSVLWWETGIEEFFN
jgi:hypothetical protein